MPVDESEPDVRIFDTTLRDGEQSPGFSMNVAEKLVLARQLVRLGVDVIEAGFPAASEQDFSAVREIAREVGQHSSLTVCGLARAMNEDIERCFEAVRYAARPRIHVFLATSDVHLEHKLRMTRRQVLRKVSSAVAYAASLVSDVEFSAEDATRSDVGFLCEVVEAAIEAGATTINIPDTVGYTTPEEYRELIQHLRAQVSHADSVVFSVHCHDDLGLAVANSLAAVSAGARQVECTINGIGERAGNAALEEIVMAFRTRPDRHAVTTSVETTELYPTSRLLSHLTGVHVQPNKAIVGDNAFAHEAGIHQHGVLEERTTYEILRAEDVGLPSNSLVLGKHSGRHALARRLEELGIELSDEELPRVFGAFKALADRKKTVYDDDLLAIASGEVARTDDALGLEYLHVLSGTAVVPSATVGIGKNDGCQYRGTGCGDGPVDAVFGAIDSALGTNTKLRSYSTRAATPGQDAVGEVTVTIEARGRAVVGKGASTDVLEAAGRAYLDAIVRSGVPLPASVDPVEAGKGELSCR